LPDFKEFLHHASELRFQSKCSIIPLRHKDKIPAISWERYQQNPPGLGEIENWWSEITQKECYNIGVVCGEVSERLVVIDIDPRHGGSSEKIEKVLGFKLPATVQVLTGGEDNGLHYYYRDYTGECDLKTFKLMDGVEVRGNGSMVVAPPSIHPVTNNVYVWKYSPYDYEITQLPKQIMEISKQKQQSKTTVDNEEFGDKPTVLEIQAVISEIDIMLEGDAGEESGLIQSFIHGNYFRSRIDGWDRSGWSYKLARLLVENGVFSVNEKRKIAIAVYGAAVHQSKFKDRPDRWQDCINITKEAIAGEMTLTFINGHSTEEEITEPEINTPVFPVEACTGIIGDIAKGLSKYSESSLSYLFFSALTVFSTLVCGNYTLDTSLRVKPTMYTILLGESGLSRKSVAIKSVVEFFADALGDTFIERVFSGYFGSGEGILRKLSTLGEKNPKGLAQLLWYVDEFEEVMSRGSMEGSVLAPVLQQLYEDTNFEYYSLSKSLSVGNAYLNIISASTIDTFNSMWSGKMTEGGLFNRMWLVAPEDTERMAIPDSFGDSLDYLKDALKELVLQIDAGPCISFGDKTVKVPHTKTIVMSPEAKELWSSFYLQDLLNMIRSDPECARRLDAYGLRLAILLSLSKGELEEISADTIREVIMLLRYEYLVRVDLKPPDAKNDIARIEQIIMRKLQSSKEVNRRELYRLGVCQRYGTGMFEKALENLHKTGFVTIKRAKGDRVNVFVEKI